MLPDAIAMNVTPADSVEPRVCGREAATLPSNCQRDGRDGAAPAQPGARARGGARGTTRRVHAYMYSTVPSYVQLYVHASLHIPRGALARMHISQAVPRLCCTTGRL